MLSFEEKTTQPWYIYFQIAGSNIKKIKTNPLNIIFDDFGIWLLGYRTQFSCLYLPQWLNFVSTVWLRSTDEYVLF